MAIAAMRSGTNRCLYQQLLQMSDAEFRALLLKVFDNDIPHHDFTWLSYAVIERNEKKAGTVAGWVEAADEVPSTTIKMNLLIEHLGAEKIQDCLPQFQKISPYSIKREPGTFQFEYANVRFGGFVYQLHDFLIAQNKDRYAFNKSQMQFFGGNRTILKAVTRIGFEVVEEIKVDDPEVQYLFPYPCIRMAEKRYDL